MNQRDSSLDLMRVIGVLLIMIAHAEPPEWLDQLRNFGTPLLIVASGATYASIYRFKSLEALPFLRKRISRLILPAWAFLAFFFLFFYFVAKVTGKNYPFDLVTIASSFTLSGGIGYVWILNIYLFMALITPIAFRAKQSIPSRSSYFSFIAAAYLLYELMLRIVSPYVPGQLVQTMNFVVFAYVPYALLYLYGLRLGELSNKQVAIAGAVSLVLFAGMAIHFWITGGSFVRTQNFKYPPTFYYLSYAFFALNATYLLCRKFFMDKKSNMVLWLSTHSLWIYLWHILAIYLLSFSMGIFQRTLFASLLRIAFLLGFAVCLTYMQSWWVGKDLSKNDNSALRGLAKLLV